MATQDTGRRARDKKERNREKKTDFSAGEGRKRRTSVGHRGGSGVGAIHGGTVGCTVDRSWQGGRQRASGEKEGLEASLYTRYSPPYIVGWKNETLKKR